MKFQKKRISYWVPIAVLMVLMSLLLVYCQSQENLNVYNRPDETTATDASGNPVTTPTETKPSSSTPLKTYQNETLKISYAIPEGWQRVTMDGYETYIHAPSAASAQIQIMDFNPAFITVNADMMKNDLLAAGLTLESFQWDDTTTYTCVYRKGDTKTGTACVDRVTFDKAHVVRLFLSWPLKYYDRLVNDMLAIAESFKWEKETPYPENVSLVYNSAAKCEFGYPVGWYTQIQNNVYLAQDPKTKTLMSMTINPSTVQYDKMTKLDYVNWASSGRSGFSLIDVKMDKTTIYGTSTYSAGNSSMVLVHYMYSSGAYEYIFTFEIPYSDYQQQKELVATLINTFRTYK